MRNKVALLLSVCLLVMSMIPIGAAFFFISDAFSSQESIYKNRNLNEVFDTTQKHLRALSKFEPEKETELKALFSKIQDLKLIYGDDSFFSDRVKSSLSKYFIIGFGASLFFSLFLGLTLAKKINQIYKKAFDELQQQKDRAQYLEEMAHWQNIAKQMAHEIRRPLQPILSWVSNIKMGYSLNTNEKYVLLLNEATTAVEEEISNLNKMVTEFSQFADLPKPVLIKTMVSDFFETFIEQYSKILENIHLSFYTDSRDLLILMDVNLMRQVLTNLIENAMEANPGSKVEMKINIKTDFGGIILDIFNSGKSLPEEQRIKIFDPYYSTKNNHKNMGLGLSIVKFAILEQGGVIECVEETQGVRFRIQFPICSGVVSVS